MIGIKEVERKLLDFFIFYTILISMVSQNHSAQQVQ